ncbi:MAG: hypothetical protein R2787_07705 [Saprospiraceae bacterium]
MKNVLFVLICFAFAAVSVNAQDSTIPQDDQGTYVNDNSTLVVSATGISDGTSTSGSDATATDGSGSATDGAATGVEGSGTDATEGTSAPKLTDVKRTPKGWVGIYTTAEGKAIKVRIEWRTDDNGNKLIRLTDATSGDVVAKYKRQANR